MMVGAANNLALKAFAAPKCLGGIVRVQMVELKDVMLPLQLQRAMAAEAEAAREARAKVIAAEGERDASESLKEAARVIQRSPQALQVKFLDCFYLF